MAKRDLIHELHSSSNANKVDKIKAGPRVIKLFSCSSQLSMKFILLINVKMPTIAVILTFMSKINTTSERQSKKLYLWHFSFYEQLKFHAQLS